MSVVFHRLGTINKEMGITMMRTSRSPIFAEVHDFSCAICDWVPRIVAQVDGVPSHTASSMMAARAIVEKFRDEMKPGDVYLINDPYEGGTHLADVTVVKPIYYQGELLFMAINRAHHLDIGGMVAGSYSPEAREIFHEGLRIPAIRVYEKDEPIQYIIDLLKINTRMPDLFESDIRAQVASCNVAERRLLEMADELGTERVKEILDGIQVYAEQMMRRRSSTTMASTGATSRSRSPSRWKGTRCGWTLTAPTRRRPASSTAPSPTPAPRFTWRC
jgi:N-methylhydantoinase B